MEFRPTYVPADWQPPAMADTFTFITDGESRPRPIAVGVHQGRIQHDGEEYPVTLTVAEDGSVLIRSEPYRGD